MKKQIIIIGVVIILIGLLSGCFGESPITDEEEIISFAKAIDIGINETENMTLNYSHFANKQNNGWYTISVYLNYVNEPWRNKWYGTLWFKMDGSNYLEQ